MKPKNQTFSQLSAQAGVLLSRQDLCKALLCQHAIPTLEKLDSPKTPTARKDISTCPARHSAHEKHITGELRNLTGCINLVYLTFPRFHQKLNCWTRQLAADLCCVCCRWLSCGTQRKCSCWVVFFFPLAFPMLGSDTWLSLDSF